MAVHSIAYVELYTRDKVSAVDYLVSAMGFTRIADSVEVDRSSVLLGQGDVRLVVTSGRGLGKFLDAHGDGVADIALACDAASVTGIAEAAGADGAAVTVSPHGSTVVTGCGSVSHSLVPAPAGTGPLLPPGRNWVLDPDRDHVAPGRIDSLDHIAVCVTGGALTARADYYQKVFGLGRYSSEYVDVGGQAMDSIVVRSDSGGVTFTLVAPDPGKDAGQLDAFLERNGGEGAQHLAFLVEDIIPTVREQRSNGVEFLSTPDTYYDMLAERFTELRTEIAQLRDAQVLADRDEWGHLLQVFSRSPYPRNTLFYELIQRRGSRGFGSSNIRALYEAVERDRLTAG